MGKPGVAFRFGADLGGAAAGKFPFGSRIRRAKVSKYFEMG